MMRVWIMETMIILDKNVMEELIVDMVEEDKGLDNRDREEITEDNNNSVEKKRLLRRDKDVSLEMLV